MPGSPGLCLPSLLLLFISCLASLAHCLIGVLEPPDPLVQSGSTMVLNCTLRNHTLGYNSSNIAFKLGNKVLPQEYTSIVSPWTAELRLPNVQRNISGIHLFCKLPNDAIIDNQVITVADEPVKPNITKCIVYNWMSMTCYWEPKEQDTGLETKQELIYTLFVDTTWYKCPAKVTGNECRWSFQEVGNISPTSTVTLKVQASNLIKTITSDPITANLKNQVKPDPVVELQSRATTNTSMELRWKPPSAFKTLRYNITYYSKFAQPNTVLLNVYTNKTEESLVLADLKPYTMYTVEASSIPLIELTDKVPQGYHSEIVQLLQRTLPGVPSKNPDIGPGSFYIHEGSFDRNVTVYWKPLSELHMNAAELCYLVSWVGHLGSADKQKVCGDKFSASFNVAKEEEFEVEIVAESEVGRDSSLASSTISIPATVLPSVDDLIPIIWNVTHFKISWTPLKHAASYTLFYCRKIGGIVCKEAPTWTVYDSNTTSVELNVVSSDYSFAMSVQYADSYTNVTASDADADRDRRSAATDTMASHRHPMSLRSSSMFWNKCVYHNVQKLKAPEKFRVANVLKGGSLTVEWSHPGCSYGYIQMYTIFYCLKDNCQVVHSVNASYKDNIITWSKSLEEDKEYDVWMVAQSPYSKSSDPTAKKKVTVPRAGLTNSAVVGISISCIIVTVLIICGICFVVRFTRKKWRSLTDEVPITAPGIERIGHSDLNSEQITYTGESLMGARGRNAEHSGMARIAENESNTQLENNINRRHYYPTEAYEHERALLMNGTAVRYSQGAIPYHTDSLESLQELNDTTDGTTGAEDCDKNSYYNENEVDKSLYDSPGNIERKEVRNNGSLEHADLMQLNTDNQPIENSGQSSIAPYSLVDQCLVPKTPPALLTLNKIPELPLLPPDSSDYVRDISAIPLLNTNRNNGNNNSPGTKCISESGNLLQDPVDIPNDKEEVNNVPSRCEIEAKTGYVLAPPETKHALAQQLPDSSHSETSHAPTRVLPDPVHSKMKHALTQPFPDSSHNKTRNVLSDALHDETRNTLCDALHDETRKTLCDALHDETINTLCDALHDETRNTLCDAVHDETRNTHSDFSHNEKRHPLSDSIQDMTRNTLHQQLSDSLPTNNGYTCQLHQDQVLFPTSSGYVLTPPETNFSKDNKMFDFNSSQPSRLEEIKTTASDGYVQLPADLSQAASHISVLLKPQSHNSHSYITENGPESTNGDTNIHVTAQSANDRHNVSLHHENHNDIPNSRNINMTGMNGKYHSVESLSDSHDEQDSWNTYSLVDTNRPESIYNMDYVTVPPERCPFLEEEHRVLHLDRTSESSKVPLLS